MQTVLNLAIVFDDRRVVECARALLEQLPKDQWYLLRQLAAEITALGESAAAGQRMLVVPAASLELALEAFGNLRVAGRE
jgi:hypothetical protein